MRNVFLICFCLLFTMPAAALEIAGVSVPETIKTDTGATLTLNGAGIRSKFVFDIYVAQLYLEHPSADAKQAIAAEGHKRMVMHFLYDKVEKEKLTEGWNEGFTGNNSPDQLKGLQERIDQFNAMFTDAKKDEVIILDYAPESGTKVTIAGVEKGVIPGKDFNDAMLAIWLGEKPVTKDLKAKLLGAGK